MSAAHPASPKVLLIKTSSLGDVVHTLPAITDAARAIPGITFDWVVEESFAEIPSWHPSVVRVIPVAIRRWRKNIFSTLRNGEWGQFREQIKSAHYDLIIDAQGLLKSAVLTRGLEIPVHGLDKESAREPLAAKFYTHSYDVPKGQHAVERIRQLFAKALSYQIPTKKGNFALNRSMFDDFSHMRPPRPYLVFIHGTTWEDKHWPESYWLELAQKATSAGYIICLPWGNDHERQRAERIANIGPGILVLPKLPLKGVAAIIAGATKVVAVDTGLGHLTAALEIPAVSLYGPTSPVLVGAYGEVQKHLTLADCPKLLLDEQAKVSVSPAIFAPMTPDIVWQAMALENINWNNQSHQEPMP